MYFDTCCNIDDIFEPCVGLKNELNCRNIIVFNEFDDDIFIGRRYNDTSATHISTICMKFVEKLLKF